MNKKIKDVLYELQEYKNYHEFRAENELPFGTLFDWAAFQLVGALQ